MEHGVGAAEAGVVAVDLAHNAPADELRLRAAALDAADELVAEHMAEAGYVAARDLEVLQCVPQSTKGHGGQWTECMRPGAASSQGPRGTLLMSLSKVKNT